jgi:hypothetical protein
MSSIPLDLQRRFERRRAARFLRPNPPTAPEEHQLEKQDQQRVSQGRKKNPLISRTAPAGLIAEAVRCDTSGAG